MTEGRRQEATTVVIVHGAFLDGSGWQGVHSILRRDGYDASIVQNPTISLAGDVAATKSAVASSRPPVLLVGHSYGGVVITEAGNDPRVVGLVYIAAFVPDEGESVATLFERPPLDAMAPPLPPPRDGQVVLDAEALPLLLAGDVPRDRAAFLADSQVPWGVEALGGAVGLPAWKVKPSWYLLAADDRFVPPAAQRFMAQRAGATLVEASGSHVVYVSHPIVVAALIERAAAELVRP